MRLREMSAAEPSNPRPAGAGVTASYWQADWRYIREHRV